jgi:hypothetical protein
MSTVTYTHQMRYSVNACEPEVKDQMMTTWNVICLTRDAKPND